MQGICTYIPETNYVSREYSVAAILLLLFMVLISLVSVLNILYFYICTFRSMCAVPNMAVFWSLLLLLSSSSSFPFHIHSNFTWFSKECDSHRASISHFIHIHLLFSYLTYRQHHTGISVKVNRQLLYKAHRNEINGTYSTYSTRANPPSPPPKSTTYKQAIAFKKKYILRIFVHKIRAGAGKQYENQNIDYRF